MDSGRVLLAFALAPFVAGGTRRMLPPPSAELQAKDPALLAEREADLAFLLETIRKAHPDPYARHAREEWDREVEASRRGIGAIPDATFLLRLMRLVSLLEDGHSTLIPAPSSSESRSYAIDFEFFDDGLFVLAADPVYGEAVGRRVVAVEGAPVEEVFQRARPFLGGDNDQGARTLFEHVLAFPAFHEALGLARDGVDPSLTVSDVSGKETTVRLRPPEPGPPRFLGPRPPDWIVASPEPIPLRHTRPERPYWFEELPGGKALYLRFARVEHAPDEPFRPFCQRLFARIAERGVERLVIDLRGNRGGNNYIPQALVHGVIRSRVDGPGGVIVLIDGKTFSAAMNCASYLERETWSLFAGAPTGAAPNHFGDPETFTLPRSGHLLLCSRVRWQDSDPRDARRWIYPDLPAPLRFREYLAGDDPALEAALRYEPGPIEGYTNVQPRAHWKRATQKGGAWPP
jgi:hypothetical protein